MENMGSVSSKPERCVNEKEEKKVEEVNQILRERLGDKNN
jgi:hypothetical protein